MIVEGLINVKPIKTKAYEELLNWLKTFKSFRLKCCLVYGDLGVGKTFTIHRVIETLGYNLIYITSDLVDEIENITSIPSTLFMNKRVVHIDRPYTELKLSGKKLRSICESSCVPIIIEDTIENYKYYNHIMCHKIRVEPPSLYYIANIIRSEAIVEPNYSLVSRDVRQSLLLALGSRPQGEHEWIRFVEDLLMGRDPKNLERTHLPIIIDNLSAFYGVDLVNLVDVLTYVDRILSLRPNYEYISNPFSINASDNYALSESGDPDGNNFTGDLSVFLSKIKPLKMTKQIENYFYPKLREVREARSLGD